ncbi:ABC transporter permease [Acidobacteria bacterium AB60]|nr:ABC transporter permease [Acidobacteria bacterium AB60]
MQMIFQDLRYALRQLRKSPGFAATAIITLALGIGANTAIFTLVKGILLRSLPVTDPAQLYRIGDTDNCCVNGGFVGENGDFDIFSYDLYLHFKRSAPEFEQLAAVQAGQPRFAVRRGEARGKELRGEWVSGNYFSTLGLGAAMGRAFNESDDREGAPPVVVLSSRAWQNEFGADPSVIGSPISIQARPFTVIGVAPSGFFGDRVTDSPADFWMPLSTEPYLHDGATSYLHHADSHWLYPIGRVRPGTSIPALQAKLSVALRQFLFTREVYTRQGGDKLIPKQHVTVVPGGGGIQNLQQETGKGLKLLMILSSIVLLIACANIANLLLARSTARRAEIAVRMAMGAGRKRVIRQALTESILLSCMGGIAGLGVAYAGSRTILALAFPDAPNLPVSASPSLPVLLFAFGVSIVTGILFGLAPAWLALQAQPAEVLRGVNRATRDHSGVSQKVLVILQAALSVVLLAGAILMSRSLANLEQQNFGVQTGDRYVLHFDPEGAGYSVDRLQGLYRSIESRFSALPAVSHVALALYSPLEGDNWGDCALPQGHPVPAAGEQCNATWDRVTPQFLQSIGVPIERGRDLSEQDTATSQMVAIVNQTFVKRFYPNEDPIGKHFGINDPKYSGAFEIVGIFRDFKMNNPREPVRPVYLRPMAQQYQGFSAPYDGGEKASMFAGSILVSFRAPQENVEELLRRTLASVDPNLTVVGLQTFERQVNDNFVQDRLLARLTGLFGVLALVLASVGLYGVMSYFVARRTGEIGIRMALGATRTRVMGIVLQGAGWQLGLGLVIGVIGALLAGRLMASQLYGVSTYDPVALGGAALVLATFALAATLLPARRAASIEPMKALRTE